VYSGGGLGGGGLGDGSGASGGAGGDVDHGHPKDSVIVTLSTVFPPVSAKYPALIVMVYLPASACEDAAEEIGTLNVQEFLPFVSNVRQRKV
tara:strand:- start:227 stop:502 length:276 start_codon:yes stop_codon:yes gene_type:complete